MLFWLGLIAFGLGCTPSTSSDPPAAQGGAGGGNPGSGGARPSESPGSGGSGVSATGGTGVGGAAGMAAPGIGGSGSGGATGGGSGGDAGEVDAGAPPSQADSGAGGSVPPANGPARIVLVAGGGTGGDGSPAKMARVAEPFGTAVDPVTGEIYIAEVGGKIRRVDPNGVISTVVGAGAAGPGGKFTLRQPHDLLFQPGTRNLFIADTMASRVLRLDAATGEVTVFAGAGSALAGNLSRTYCLAFDREGEHLYVTNNGAGSVTVINLKSNSVIASIPTGGGPRAITVDSKRNLYVVAAGAQVMRRIDPAGKSTEVARGLAAPKKLDVDADDNVLICDTESHTILRYSPSTGMTTKIAGAGGAGSGTLDGPPERAQFGRPHGVFADKQGRIYIADSNNDRIVRIER